MKANSILVCTALYLATALCSCTQSADHRKNEQFMAEQQTVSQNTVLLNNSAELIPLKDLEKLSIASVSIGAAFTTEFDSILNKYTEVKSLAIPGKDTDFSNLIESARPYNTIILQITAQSLNDPAVVTFIKGMQKGRRMVIILSGDVTSLKMLDQLDCPIIWAAESSAESAQFIAQLIFGGVGANGKLRQHISERYTSGMGYSTKAIRLKYTVAEDAGLNVKDLSGIDDIAAEAIREKAAPSITVMVVKDAKVIFNKAYGTHTYIDPAPTRISDIYDLASVTKTSATTLAVMRLLEKNKIRLNASMGTYIPSALKTNKNSITVKQLMLHEAGLVPYIPFHSKLKKTDHRQDSSAAYPTRIADRYFLRKGYFANVMWPAMLKSGLTRKGVYVYSDLSMYFMKDIVERQSGAHLEDFVQQNFYKPLGMKTAGFNPRKRFPKERLIPTENDVSFRKTLLQGYVHDQGAAMAGGVSGHAGLFSTANDLAILYQMLLNKGTYGGVRYFKPETVDMFTSRQSAASYRGFGFDRNDPGRKIGYPSRLASSHTYGHTGYTGTCVWVDPEYKLVYIFLSNRVNPKVTGKLTSLNIRGRIQDVIYEAISNGKN